MNSISNALAHGRQLLDSGNLTAASQIFHQILAASPNEADAFHLLGLIEHRKGNLASALKYVEHAIFLNGKDAAYHCNLGNLYRENGMQDHAVACLNRAIALNPMQYGAHLNLGLIFEEIGRPFEAAECFRNAIKLQPNIIAPKLYLAEVLKSVNAIDDAIDWYRQVLAVDPHESLAMNNLALLLCERGDLEDSEMTFRRAMDCDPGNAILHSNFLYCINFFPRFDARSIWLENCKWDEKFAKPLRSKIRSHDNDRNCNRRLRIGYVSPDFRNHCQALFMMPLLSSHDRKEVEIFCYSDVARPDSYTAKLRAESEHWRDIAGVKEEQLCEQIRGDAIDILVDVTMHMSRSHLSTFAMKPAPVQVCWLAYPGTTGLATMDFRLSDPYLEPPGSNQAYYSEKTILLDTFWCYDPMSETTAVRELPALNNGHITFGCLNNFAKLTTQTIDLWSPVIRAVKNSRLLLLAPEGICRDRTLQLFSKRGVSAERIEFRGRMSRDDYLTTYNEIDICLDTTPYNGHTTSLDSYWMGVPVVSQAGRTILGRAGLSQLSNLGMPELVGNSSESFVRIAIELANDLSLLARIREGLRQRMLTSPLMDKRRFARSIENAFRAMWDTWCNSR